MTTRQRAVTGRSHLHGETSWVFWASGAATVVPGASLHRLGRPTGPDGVIGYLLEAYKPAAKRECGYFGMPILVGTSIVGRIAVRVSKGAARIEGHQLIDGQDPAHLEHALAVICGWAGVTSIPALTTFPQSVGVTP